MHTLTAAILAIAITLAPVVSLSSGSGLTCVTRYTRTGKPWCECKTARARWAAYPLIFCQLAS